MGHKKIDECNIPDDGGDSSKQFLLDNRRTDTAQELIEFAKFTMATVERLSQDDQGRARPRY